VKGPKRTGVEIESNGFPAGTAPGQDRGMEALWEGFEVLRQMAERPGTTAALLAGAPLLFLRAGHYPWGGQRGASCGFIEWRVER